MTLLEGFTRQLRWAIMKGSVIGLTLPAMHSAHAEATFGECEVNVSGATSTSFRQPALDPRKSHKFSSGGMSLSWAIVQEEAIHKVDEARMKLIESATIHLLNVTCTNEKGELSFMPTPGSTAKQIPSGPGKYRFVGLATPGKKPGDLLGAFTVVANGARTVVQPSKEPGEVVITRNDKQALEGSFKFTDGKSVVSGQFKLIDPYL